MKGLYWDCGRGVSAEGLAGCLAALAGEAEKSAEVLNGLNLPGAFFSLTREGDEMELSVRVDESFCAEHPLLCRAAQRSGAAAREDLVWLAACLALTEELGVGRVMASPVNLGREAGAAELLAGKPVFMSAGARTTRAGVAILTALVDEFGDMPVMTLEKCVSCAGTRALLGDYAENRGPIVELTASIDDMTPEAVGFALERFFAAGAVEAYTSPLNMKKSRPGVLLTVMCPEARRDDMLREIFRHTTTIGVRVARSERYALARGLETVKTPLGDVRRKVSHGYGVRRAKWEYDDLARIARETGLGLEEVRAKVEEGAKV